MLNYSTFHRPRGFSLIEMMIAIVLGLILLGSVLALVVSSMRANAQTVSSTRLTQELRALTDIVARELRRARYQEAAVTNVGRGAAFTNPFSAIAVVDNVGATTDDDSNAATTDGDCVQYAYALAPGGNFRGIWLGGTATAGTVVLDRGVATPTCGDPGTVISSPEVHISRLTFNLNPTADTIAVTVAGRLIGDTVTRRYSEIVRIRSE